MTASHYEGIAKACREIAYCNNGIRRDRPEEQQAREFEEWFGCWVKDRLSHDALQLMSDWLLALNEDDLLTVCDGEETEREALMASAHPMLNELLNAYFDEVC